MSGRVPFTGTSSKEIVKKHIYEKPKALTELVSGLPDDIWQIIAKMIAKNPDERYASASELIEVLEKLLKNGTQVLQGKSTPAKPSGKRPAIRRRRRRRR